MATMKTSPEKPHFFKPMLPDFKQGIDIPKGFLKYVKIDQYEHAILRRADKKWQVKMNGRRLEDGWVKFAEQNDLQVRDILVFRHEGDMEFEVFTFDFMNQCEIEYEEEQQKTQNVEETSKKFEPKEVVPHAPFGRSQFVCTIRPYWFKSDYLCLPKQFASGNNLMNKKCDLIIRDEKQRSWNLKLTSYDSSRVNIGGNGWHKFVVANDLKEGDDAMFEIVTNGEKPIWQFRYKSNYNIKSSEKASPIAEVVIHKPFDHSRFVCTIKPYCLLSDSLSIPKQFALANGLFNIKKHGLIVSDERQRSWNVILRAFHNSVYLIDGWNKIRDANCLKEGDHIMFEVVTNGNKPIWKFYDKPNYNIKSSSKASSLAEVVIHKPSGKSNYNIKTSRKVSPLAEVVTHKPPDKSNYNIKSSRKASEVVTHKPFDHSRFVCTVRPYCLSRDSLLIPTKFASANGLFNIKKCDLIVRDERQRSWNAILRAYSNCVYLKKGWNNIRDANCLKEGDRIMFEVVTDGNKPIWKFYSKISQDDANIIEEDD